MFTRYQIETADAKRNRLLSIHEIIAPEIFVKILKKLDYKKLALKLNPRCAYLSDTKKIIIIAG